MDGAAPVHYMRPNDKVWTPPHVAFLDSETRTAMAGDVEILELRLWVAKLIDRREARKRSGPVYWGQGTDPGSLAAQLADWSRGRRSLWVYAHNLSFDLVTTGLPVVMSRQGWRVTDFALRSESPWVRLSNGKTTITVADSWSWLRAPLGEVAALYGREKEPLPDDDGPDDEWWARCRTDVDLTAQAMGDLMDWWDRNQLGRWTISGPACGWNAMRHQIGRKWLLVDPDPETLARDRLAIRGGRRDSQRVGDLGRGDYVEVDFVAAYPTIAANLPLPRARGATFDSLPLDHRAIGSESWGVMAEVTVTTDKPRYPMRWGGVTWYPMGTFRTRLAGPEIAWARETGDLVSIGPGQFHQLSWDLSEWAVRVLQIMSGEFPDSPPVARLAAKTWGRSVLGRFAARGQIKEALGFAPSDGWGYVEGWDHDHARHGALVDMCGQRYWTVYDTEGENTYPGVFAWVESHVRARLGRLIETVPAEAWVACDTDGVTLDMSRAHQWAKGRVKFSRAIRDGWGVAARLCQLAEPVTWPLVARPKRSHDHMRLLGPQHVITDKDRKLSGVRRDAEETGPWEFTARDWPSLRWQMAHSAPGRYARPERSPKLTRPLVHRWITDDGECWPVWAEVGPDGENRVLPWRDSWGPLVDVPLATLQYKGLDLLQ